MAGTSPAMTQDVARIKMFGMVAHSKISRNQKARGGFRRGLSSCDGEHMPVICPTCQIFSKALVATQDTHALKQG
jgi:hypothetical protein